MKTAIDERILSLPRYLKKNGKIKRIQEFYDEVGISKQRFNKIKKQDISDINAHFTVEQIHKIGKAYDIDFNWIFGRADAEIQTKSKQ
ncbi:hypothetical protein [Riemerella anatipestifer]|uniref:hypothetical protein n=1 Tax=Riemerella anatipestifer TaxID=34085 RepID=UPI001BD921C3|nr:hypothetical protein [Riemerella anatipestifer]MBT0551575.1 hypothetical protein [Riemerella anatipestifer]MBT0552740.1 hypothetical protein [Riemerella anatipestifer]MCE3023476.1 hypothetical protein [Riemerella anatipestifer]MCU7558938.1 hypothetical protein [Riemerella anatipestifer]MCU7567579.1 hypothetical protein [Riemerella anatipestifer]